MERLISGRLFNIRKLKNISFLIIKEEGNLIQVVVKEPSLLEFCEKIKNNSYLLITVNQEERDLVLLKINKSYSSEPIVPYDLYSTKLEDVDRGLKLKNRPYDLGSIENYNIFTYRSRLLGYIREFFLNNGHVEINTPKIIYSGAEGGSELFKVKYFEKTYYLAQSPQLYKQMAINQGFKRVFEIASIYRGQKSNTNRHLSEAISIDFEMELPLKDPQKTLLDYNISFLRHILNRSLKDPWQVVRTNSEKLLKELDLIKDGTKEGPTPGFAIISDFKREEKPFYIKFVKQETMGYDIEYNGLELTSGGVREENYEKLVKQMLLRGHTVGNFNFYLNTFKGGAPFHGGSAYGLERLMMIILDKENIRDTVMYPRDRKDIFC
jgi:aspartyl/asparaginyl-tRNA synthetase